MRRGGSKRGNSRAARNESLEEVILHLGHIRAAVLVAAAALRRQNCELDEDIAVVLQRCVSDPLAKQLEKLQAARHLPGARMHRVRSPL